jgi:hypothetical protein
MAKNTNNYFSNEDWVAMQLITYTNQDRALLESKDYEDHEEMRTTLHQFFLEKKNRFKAILKKLNPERLERYEQTQSIYNVAIGGGIDQVSP